MEAQNLIRQTISELFNVSGFTLEHPIDEQWGDLATNVAMISAKKEGENPREKAQNMAEELSKQSRLKDIVEKIEVAGPGFINFTLAEKYLIDQVSKALKEKDGFGKGLRWNGMKVMVEYTDPNPFKQFHIGHLMSNAIGECISRLVEFSGGEVKRACYQGDVGMHVAKSVWGIRELLKEENVLFENIGGNLDEKAAFLGKAYARGAKEFEENDQAKEEINSLNKVIYDRSDPEINRIYDQGRKWSLEYFETIYKKLGTKFDYYFFESEAGPIGKELVMDHTDDGVFEKSEGAIVFKGEKYGLHTRVFVNSAGLPTYEAKDLGLAKTKYDSFPYDKSIIVTGNEVNAYFNVVLKALSLIYPELAMKTEHIGHGMLKLKQGKMSSRTGNVVTGESLLADAGMEIRKKMQETGKISEIEDADEVINAVSVAAIKYSMLKQSPGKDIVFDFETSLSFEGDSGPYLQYAYARAQSVLEKSEAKMYQLSGDQLNTEEKELLRWFYRFGEVTDSAVRELSPNLLCTYLTELAGRFNHFYAKCTILGNEREEQRLAMTAAVAQVLKTGLWLLGTETVAKM